MRICSGRFTPIPPGRYSPELINFCHSLLSLEPRKRWVGGGSVVLLRYKGRMHTPLAGPDGACGRRGAVCESCCC